MINSTSNVFFSKEFHMLPTGTYVHEFVLMYRGIKTMTLAYTNKASLKYWFKEYKGDDGIALTDTITNIFLKDFDLLESSI